MLLWASTDMVQILPYIQIVLSILLVTGVLLQRSEASLGAALGGDSSSTGHFMRRGFEKILFKATFVIAALYTVFTFASILFDR